MNTTSNKPTIALFKEFKYVGALTLLVGHLAYIDICETASIPFLPVVETNVKIFHSPECESAANEIKEILMINLNAKFVTDRLSHIDKITHTRVYQRVKDRIILDIPSN